MKHAASTQRKQGGFFPSGWGLLKFPWHWPQRFFPSLCSSVSARLALGDLGSFIPSLTQLKPLLILPRVPRAVETPLWRSVLPTEEPPDGSVGTGAIRSPPALWLLWGGPNEHLKSVFPRDAQAFCLSPLAYAVLPSPTPKPPGDLQLPGGLDRQPPYPQGPPASVGCQLPGKRRRAGRRWLAVLQEGLDPQVVSCPCA